MRGDIVFRVYGVHRGRADDVYFGAFRTRGEADTKIATLAAREMHGENWARRYHDQGFVVREAVIDTDFELPSLPKPRDKWVVRTTPVSNGPYAWHSTRVEVCRRCPDGLESVASYLRNHALYATFEPFRQGTREFALISRDYEATAVLDLATGEVIAEETEAQRGFCPVGFYVPDWWDLNDGSRIPGSEYWTADDEWPTGNFGFVWGCIWGDDSSWKVEHLDLSRVGEGVIARDARYGYLALADAGWQPPWLDLERPLDAPRSDPPPFLEVWKHAGVARVWIATALGFELDSGRLDPWQLKNLTREESGPE
jgi:hypothetical protein